MASLHIATPSVGANPRAGWASRFGHWWGTELAELRRPGIEGAWCSLRGVGHSRNQDAVLAAAPLFAVADGVGGGKAGELASSQMLAWCRQIRPAIWRHPDRLAKHLRGADVALAASLQALSPGGPSATTFAGAWLGGNGRGHLAHVGDVRILGLRSDRHGVCVSALTQDQTYAALGEAAPPGGHAGDPARMIGVGVIGQPPVQAVALREGQMLLLCSDGFHRFVSPETLAGHVAQARRLHWPLERLAQTLAQLAQDSGSHDDVSVLLVRRNPRWGVRQGLWWALAAALMAEAAVVLTTAFVGLPMQLRLAGPESGAATAASAAASARAAVPTRTASGSVQQAPAATAASQLSKAPSASAAPTRPGSAASALPATQTPTVLMKSPVPSAVAASAIPPRASAPASKEKSKNARPPGRASAAPLAHHDPAPSPAAPTIPAGGGEVK